MVASANHRWLALALLSVVQFMIVLDIAIVNVALPSIQTDLGFSQENLQWVISAYALVFGGFLLLGGRTADLLGRRRMFVIGLAVFSVGVAPRGPRVERAVADRRPRLPGARRGDHRSGRALDPDDDVLRGQGTEHRPRRLGRRRRLRCRCGRAPRRRLHRRVELGVDLLPQHPGRPRCDRPHAGAPRREPRHHDEELRRPRRGARHRRPLGRRVRHHAGERVRLDVGRDDRHLRRRRRSPRRASSCGSSGPRSR